MSKKKRPVCISVINMKGGVGKTTIAALLGRYASLRLRIKVLAIDLDPQANLSQAFMNENYKTFIDERAPSIVEIFQGYQPPSVGTTSPNALDIDNVAVSNTLLGGRKLKIIPSRFDFSDNLIDSVKPDPRVLARFISDKFDDRDLVIIDCAPTESIFSQAAYHASRYVLVPVRPEYFATIGFPLLKDSLRMFRDRNRGHTIDVIGVVINNSSYHYSGNRGGPERARSIIDIKEEADKNGWHVFNSQIPFSRGYPKMMRGDFSSPGDAPLYERFGRELFHLLGFE